MHVRALCPNAWALETSYTTHGQDRASSLRITCRMGVAGLRDAAECSAGCLSWLAGCASGGHGIDGKYGCACSSGPRPEVAPLSVRVCSLQAASMRPDAFTPVRA